MRPLRAVGDEERVARRRFAAWAPRRALLMSEVTSWPEFARWMRSEAVLPPRWPLVRLPAGFTRRVVWPTMRALGQRRRAGWWRR